MPWVGVAIVANVASAATLEAVPGERLFAPLVADPKELQSSAEYARTRDVVGARHHHDVGFVAVGSDVGLLQVSEGAWALQLGLAAAIFAQFDLDRRMQDLLNADYDVALPISASFEAASLRLRLAHESQHLGDQFVLAHPTVVRRDMSHEYVDLFAAYEWGPLRGYAGGGIIVNSRSDLRPLSLAAGLELHGPQAGSEITLGFVAALHVSFARRYEKALSARLVGGAELASTSSRTRLRLVLTYTTGAWPFGQFSLGRALDGAGVQLQFQP